MLGNDSEVRNNVLQPFLLLHAELPAAVFQGEQHLQTKITVYHNSEITFKLLNLFHKCPS